MKNLMHEVAAKLASPGPRAAFMLRIPNVSKLVVIIRVALPGAD